MTEHLERLDAQAVETFKKRAFLKVITHLQEAFREAHERYGVSRREFAERIDMKPSQFSRILNGGQNISVETAEAILRSMNRRMIFGSEDIRDIRPVSSNRTYPLDYESLYTDEKIEVSPGRVKLEITDYE